MIDLESETIITLSDACGYFPPDGVSTATIARWIQRGVRGGVKLETIVSGGRRLTSREAIARFIAAQNAADAPAPAITPAQRRRQSEAARQELERIGV